MNHTLVNIGILLFILGNMFVTMLMIYKSARLFVKHCNCTTRNLYWIGIFFYLLFNTYFLIFTIATQYFKFATPYYKHILIMYVVVTALFVYGTAQYIKWLHQNQCSCVDTEYQKLLTMIYIMRYYATIVTVLGFAMWWLYVRFFSV